ncbi:MAG TPA: radical SAM protein [bacterium]|nr:radical SAM protein [bacterium]HOL66497.1 radical SAM protein [bacterium]HPP12067.1 radical SAM protein [bacterium]
MAKSFHIQWHITDVCNCRCRHCYQDSFSSETQRPVSELKTIFENVSGFLQKKKMKLTVNLTGGEPLLHPDWPALVEFLSAQEVVKELGIITNGYFISRHLHFLSNFPRLKLRLSAEGVDKTTYEFFRGSGGWEKFLEGVAAARETGLEMTLMFTLLETNASQLEPALEFAWKHDFRQVIVERFIPWGRGQCLREKVVSRSNWFQVARALLAYCGLEEDLSVLAAYRAFMVVKKKKGWLLLAAPCIVGQDGLALMPDGTVYPCRRFALAIGNLTGQRLEEIWQSSPVLKMVRHRSFLKGACRDCQVKECTGCRALAYALTGDFLEEDPLCFLRD